MSETTAPVIHIRQAKPEDAGTYLKLVEAFAEYETLPPPDPQARTRLVDHLFRERPHYRLLVAEVDSEVIGYAAYVLGYSTFLARPTLMLDDLFVLPEYRKLKVGHRLFSYCARTAIAEGCERLDFFVLEWNETAKAFYRRHDVNALAGWLPYRLEGSELQRIADLGA